MSLYPLGIGLMTVITKLLFRTRTTGAENLQREGGFILSSNHVSAYDPVFLSLGAYKAKKTINYMAKEELLKIPVAGFVLKKLGAFPVRRGKGDRGAIEKAISIVGEGRVFGIFPEGHRSKTGDTLPPKSGVAVVAARTHADIIPCAIHVAGGKLRLFARVTVRFGKAIPFEALGLPDDFNTPQLKAASSIIMGKTIELLKLGSAR